MILVHFLLSGQSKNLGIFIAGFSPRAFGHHIAVDSGKIIDNSIFFFDGTSNPMSFVMVNDFCKLFIGGSLGRTK